MQCFCLFFSSLFFPRRVLRCYLVSTGMISILLRSMMMTKTAAVIICNDCNDDDNGEDVTNSALLLV